MQYHVHFNDIEPKDIQKKVQSVIDTKEKEMTSFLEHLKTTIDKNETNLFLNDDFIKERKEATDKGFYFLLFDCGDLKYWSNSMVAFDDVDDSVITKKPFFKLKNAWYLSQNTTSGDKLLITLLPLKTEYVIQNNFLVNEFNHIFNIPQESIFSTTQSNETVSFHDLDDKFLFSLKLPLNGSNTNDPPTGVVIIYLLSLICLITFFYKAGKIISTYLNGNIFLLIYASVIIFLRVYFIIYKFPKILYSQRLFDPHYYASSTILNSLGDFLVNVFIIFYLISLFSKRWKNDKIESYISTNKYLIYVSSFLGICFIIELAGLINYLLYGLIINSSISFNVSNIFELNSFSLFSFIVIGLLLASFYLVIDSLMKFITKLNISFLHLIIIIAVSIGAILLINHSKQWWDVNTVSLAFVLILCSYYIRKKNIHFLNYSAFLFVVLIFSAYSAMVIYRYNSTKEKNNRVILAEKIDKQRDFIAEHLFEDIDEKVPNDVSISTFFTKKHKNDDELQRIFHQNYFIGYWNRYDVTIKEFNLKGKALWDSTNTNNNLAYYDTLITNQGIPTLSNNLFFINNSSGRTSYIANLSVMDPKVKKKKRASIILQITSKYVQEEGGFPELLMSDKVSFSKEFSNYSYARYNNGTLVNQYGDYSYYFSSSVFGDIKEESEFIDKDGYNHLLYKINDSTMVIMSKKTEGWIQYITLLSYLFVLFFVFILILSFLKQFPLNLRSIEWNFNSRIQVSMLALVLLSFIIIGSGTVYYITQKYNTEQYEQISDHITSLLVGIENEVSMEKSLMTLSGKEILPKLPKLYNTSNSDYNIYDLDGNLIYSTQPKIYEEGIISSRMNEAALYKLSTKLKTQYIQNESIGHLKYIAAYEPIRSKDNKVIGYLDLPYFSKQTELNNEISEFLVALINFYILLFALAIILALIISNRITQPLRIISDSLSNIRLGKRNKLIELSRKDEIGALVNEYNRMVEELAISAELLAKSERESAWREMAKQVAHEIKNPLTPMKLSIQHLERAWKDNPEQMKEMIERTTKTLIEQIDTLSNIATEFSNFALMPKVNNEVFDLKQVVENTYDLYKETDGIKIMFSVYLKDENESSIKNLFIYADKEQLLRAFSNLVKNAIQAIPEETKGLINVTISDDENNYIVSISDNGVGIPEDKFDKIFVPNFTTKTAGMGLGLAMVKNSIESTGGKVWFESKPDIGTTFYVSIPKYKES